MAAYFYAQLNDVTVPHGYLRAGTRLLVRLAATCGTSSPITSKRKSVICGNCGWNHDVLGRRLYYSQWTHLDLIATLESTHTQHHITTRNQQNERPRSAILRVRQCRPQSIVYSASRAAGV